MSETENCELFLILFFFFWHLAVREETFLLSEDKYIDDSQFQCYQLKLIFDVKSKNTKLGKDYRALRVKCNMSQRNIMKPEFLFLGPFSMKKICALLNGLTEEINEICRVTK